ncbi:MAG: hypothetical protein RLZZ15_4376, partial [Verrucomicrobiota bacterium]
ATPNETLEFVAVLGDGAKLTVNLFDKTAKRSRWIAVGDKTDGIEVVGYDQRLEQVTIKVGADQKTLDLRKPATTKTPGMAAVAPNTNFNVPIAPAPVAFAAPPIAPATPAPDATTGTPAAPALPPSAPAGTVARQEEEARMLVSDLLEIGMAQRKAYEEAVKKKATEQTEAAVPATPNKGG